jgi:hypothetical protein
MAGKRARDSGADPGRLTAMAHSTHTLAHTLVLAPAILLAAGCGESVQVQWWEPTADVGGADTIVITDAYGRDDATAAVADITQAQVQEHGYFTAIDRKHRVRLEVSRQGEPWLDTGEAMQVNTVYLRVDVLEWSATSVDQFDVDPETGEETETSTTYAHVLLSVSAADDRGLLLDEHEVATDAEQAGFLDDEQVAALLDGAAAQAIGEALAVLLPTRMQESVALDVRDGALEEIVDDIDTTADLPRAERSLTAFLAQHADHAGALYDRAVVRDAMGEYAGALDDYDAAIAREGGSSEGTMYREARAGCLDRRAAARALGR